MSADGDVTLTNFLHYRKEHLVQEHPNDNAQLITAMNFDGGILGKALKGPICTYEYSGAVNMDYSHVAGLIAIAISHQLGHNFGMEHDTADCQCPDEKCIMAPQFSSTSLHHWSSCSLEYLDFAYSHGMDYCLKNHPSEIIGPVCGNGFLENGEECDCGQKEFCNNQCCNAATCMLFPNAKCAMGGCCDIDTCQIKDVVTLCRDAASECDLPEYCDGITEFCPNNTFLQNGEECGGGKAYCYDRQCQSHTDQCKLLWGQTGKMSDRRCFEQNSRANVNGNCGYNKINGTYKACRKEDAMCGRLHCTHLCERLEFGMESAAILSRAYINVRGKTITCRSAMVDLGLFNTDPGLAPNGAKCGDEKVCVNQQCIPVSTIRNKSCLYQCNGNGVCNNEGNCHCDRGYSAPYCITDGPSGSVDPASDPDGSSDSGPILAPGRSSDSDLASDPSRSDSGPASDPSNRLRIEIYPQDQTVVHRGNAVFVCTAFGNPDPQIEWRKDGKRITTQRYAVFDMPNGSVLRIEPVRAGREDATYECIADNGVGEPVKALADLDVLAEDSLPEGFPRFIRQPYITQRIEEGRNALLPCQVEGDPEPTVKWLKNLIPLNMSITRYSLVQGYSLQITDVEDEDQGNYECWAVNSHGSALSVLATLVVIVRRVPPYFYIIPEPLYKVMPGSALNITCIAVGSPMPFVKWRKGLMDIAPDHHTPIGRNILVLTDISESANYTCIAASRLGNIKTTAEVVVQGM